MAGENKIMTTADPSQQTRTVIDALQLIAFEGPLFNHVDEGLPMWANDGDRAVRQEVTFVTPFEAPPNITMGLTGVDAAHDQNLRFRLQALDVTATGFMIEFATWSDTHIARASLAWQAIGKTKSTTSFGKKTRTSTQARSANRPKAPLTKVKSRVARQARRPLAR